MLCGQVTVSVLGLRSGTWGGSNCLTRHWDKDTACLSLSLACVTACDCHSGVGNGGGTGFVGRKEEALFRPRHDILQPALDQTGLWGFVRLLPDAGLNSVCPYATQRCGTRASGHQDPSMALEGLCGLFCLTLHLLRGNSRFLPQTWLFWKLPFKNIQSLHSGRKR